MRRSWIVSLAALQAGWLAAALVAAEPETPPDKSAGAVKKNAADKPASAEKQTTADKQAATDKQTNEKPGEKSTTVKKQSAAAAKRTEVSPEEAAIRANVDAYVKAYEKQDAKALAALWSPEAVYVNPHDGMRAQGRVAIEQQFAAQFKKSPPSRLKVQVDSVRLVTPDVAVEDGRAIVLGEDDEPSESTYTAVHVKRDGKWLIDSVRETEVPPPGTAAQHLEQLDWLVGEWIDGDDEAVVHSRYHWTPNRAFLVQSFTVFVEDRLDMKGTQIIGWDPSTKQIRSWAFDSNGGFAEGTWECEGDRYVIRQKTTLPDGRKGASINTIERLSDDEFTFKSTGRQVADEMLPNVDEIVVVRYDSEANADDEAEMESEDSFEGAEADDESSAGAAIIIEAPLTLEQADEAEAIEQENE